MSCNLLLFTSSSSSFCSLVSCLSCQSGKSIGLSLKLKRGIMLCFNSLSLSFKFYFFGSKSSSGSGLFLLRFGSSLQSLSGPIGSISLSFCFSCFSFSCSFGSKLSDQSLLFDFLFKILFLLFGKSLCIFSSSLSCFGCCRLL